MDIYKTKQMVCDIFTYINMNIYVYMKYTVNIVVCVYIYVYVCLISSDLQISLW